MISNRLTLGALPLLGGFTLVAGLLLLTWSNLSSFYLATLTPLVNSLLRFEHLPFAFESQDHGLLLACRLPDGALRRFQFSGPEMACLATVGAAALFAATPGFGVRWKIRWLAGVMALFWVIDALVLYAGAHIAFLEYLDTLSPQPRRQLLEESGRLASDRREFFTSLVGLWSVWGSPTLLLGVWFCAARCRLLPLAERPHSRVSDE